jgi:hypothetical protein
LQHLLSAELAWYGTMDSPPLFSPNRAQPPSINSCFILILDFFRLELQDRQINTFCQDFVGRILLICYEKLPKIELETPLNP